MASKNKRGYTTAAAGDDGRVAKQARVSGGGGRFGGFASDREMGEIRTAKRQWLFARLHESIISSSDGAMPGGVIRLIMQFVPNASSRFLLVRGYPFACELVSYDPEDGSMGVVGTFTHIQDVLVTPDRITVVDKLAVGHLKLCIYDLSASAASDAMARRTRQWRQPPPTFENEMETSDNTTAAQVQSISFTKLLQMQNSAQLNGRLRPLPRARPGDDWMPYTMHKIDLDPAFQNAVLRTSVDGERRIIALLSDAGLHHLDTQHLCMVQVRPTKEEGGKMTADTTGTGTGTDVKMTQDEGVEITDEPRLFGLPDIGVSMFQRFISRGSGKSSMTICVGDACTGLFESICEKNMVDFDIGFIRYAHSASIILNPLAPWTYAWVTGTDQLWIAKFSTIPSLEVEHIMCLQPGGSSSASPLLDCFVFPTENNGQPKVVAVCYEDALAFYEFKVTDESKYEDAKSSNNVVQRILLHNDGNCDGNCDAQQWIRMVPFHSSMRRVPQLPVLLNRAPTQQVAQISPFQLRSIVYLNTGYDSTAPSLCGSSQGHLIVTFQRSHVVTLWGAPDPMTWEPRLLRSFLSACPICTIHPVVIPD